MTPRRGWFLAAAGVAIMAAQAYLLANEASHGALELRLRALYGRLGGEFRRRRELERTVRRDAGGVVWEALEALREAGGSHHE